MVILFLFCFCIIIGLLYLYTFTSTKDATKLQIENDGGRMLRLPDGRIVEYFVYGLPVEEVKATVPLLIIFHGYSLSGSSCSSWDEIGKQREVCIIAPSMAGWGGSTPQRGRTFQDAGQDVLFILYSLHFQNHPLIHIMGISFGAANAAASAILLMQQSTNLSARPVKSLSLLVPSWPNMSHHNFWADSSFLMWLTGRPIVDRFWQFYIAPRLDVPSLLKTLMPKDWEEFERNNPNAVDGMVRELKRSRLYHHEGACDGMRLLREGGVDIYQNRQFLQELGESVFVWYALHDTVSPANSGKYIVQMLLPNARAFPKVGGHLNMFNDLSPFLNVILSSR